MPRARPALFRTRVHGPASTPGSSPGTAQLFGQAVVSPARHAVGGRHCNRDLGITAGAQDIEPWTSRSSSLRSIFPLRLLGHDVRSRHASTPARCGHAEPDGSLPPRTVPSERSRRGWVRTTRRWTRKISYGWRLPERLLVAPFTGYDAGWGRRRMQLGARLRSLDANGGSCRAATLMRGFRCGARCSGQPPCPPTDRMNTVRGRDQFHATISIGIPADHLGQPRTRTGSWSEP